VKPALPTITETGRRGRDAAPSSQAFDTLCQQRARDMGGGSARAWSVAANGTVIEQAQILTTHNLATLVDALDVTPPDGWAALAQRVFATVLRLAGRLDRNPRPLSTIKDMAYAWRHMIFYLPCPAPVTLVASSTSSTAIWRRHQSRSANESHPPSSVSATSRPADGSPMKPRRLAGGACLAGPPVGTGYKNRPQHAETLFRRRER
jgi:hypothetical protein